MEKKTMNMEEDNCGKKKFKLCKKDNYFKVSKKYIKLKVPVTDSELIYYGTTKISDDRLNAILVQFLGGPECTPDDDKITLKAIEPIRFSDIGMRALEVTESLLVIFYVDENPIDDCQIKIFKDLVDKANSYEAALKRLHETNPCLYKENNNFLYDEKDDFLKPSEHDGDVIGGNE